MLKIAVELVGVVGVKVVVTVQELPAAKTVAQLVLALNAPLPTTAGADVNVISAVPVLDTTRFNVE